MIEVILPFSIKSSVREACLRLNAHRVCLSHRAVLKVVICFRLPAMESDFYRGSREVRLLSSS